MKKSTIPVILSADFMILRLTTAHENARSALECGGLTPPSPLSLHAGGTLRRRQAAALQGAFGTGILMAAMNLQLFISKKINADASLRSELVTFLNIAERCH